MIGWRITMQTDYIDLWQLHNPAVEQVEAGDLVRVMEEVKAAGKVRWIGISSTLPRITAFISWGVFDTFQIPYSALDRTHEAVIRAAAQSGAGTIIRGGVARGAPEEARLGNRDRWAKCSFPSPRCFLGRRWCRASGPLCAVYPKLGGSLVRDVD